MNPRVITAGVGGFMVLLGAAALVAPDLVMEHVLGFDVHPRATENFALGEVRAAYGGIFTVVGLFTVLAAMNPHLHRSRIVMVGCIWLGACGGRVLGAVMDGSPGTFGWISAALEAMVGGAMLLAAQLAAPPPDPVAATPPLEPHAPAPEPPAA